MLSNKNRDNESRRRVKHNQTNDVYNIFHRQIKFSFHSNVKLYSTFQRRVTTQIKCSTYYIKRFFFSFCQFKYWTKTRRRRKKIECFVHYDFDKNEWNFSQSTFEKLSQWFFMKTNFRFVKRSNRRWKQRFFFIEKTILFFVLMTTLRKIMFLNHANFAFHNYWLLIFSIRYTTSSMIILNFENITNDLHLFTLYANYSSNFVIIFVIVRIVKYIKLVVINHTTFCSQYWRRRYFFTFWS